MNSKRFVLMVVVAFVCSCAKKEKEPFREVTEAQLKGVARTNLDSPKPTGAQVARKKRSEAKVKDLGLPWLESLPVVEDEATLRPRQQDEVIARTLATEFAAIKAEGEEPKILDALIKDYSAEAYFSPRELAFVKNPSPPQQDLVDFAWRYECGHVFLWALGYLPALNAPNKIADVAPEVRLIKSRGPAKFASDAKLRSPAELLDQADLHYRLLWAAIELRIKGKSNPGVNEEIVQERLRALNWLIRYMNQDWDDVTTDT